MRREELKILHYLSAEAAPKRDREPSYHLQVAIRASSRADRSHIHGDELMPCDIRAGLSFSNNNTSFSGSCPGQTIKHTTTLGAVYAFAWNHSRGIDVADLEQVLCSRREVGDDLNSVPRPSNCSSKGRYACIEKRLSSYSDASTFSMRSRAMRRLIALA